MALYFDTGIEISKNNRMHPALTVDKNHPCYRIERTVIDEKPTFHWTRDQAYQMYRWYIDGYNGSDWVDEFGEVVSNWTFKEWIKNHHYLEEAGKKMKRSEITIEELWNAVEMEKEMLKAAGKESQD